MKQKGHNKVKYEEMKTYFLGKQLTKRKLVEQYQIRQSKILDDEF